MSVCMFCGHSSVPPEIRLPLTTEIERHITELGVLDFWVGNYGGFDRMAKAEVRKAKERHPGVKLFLLVPYYPADKDRIDSVGVDEIIFPEEMERVPKRLAIPRLNRYMIDRADFLISYVTHVSGGAYKTLELARSKEQKGQIHVVNLADKQKEGSSGFISF